VQVEDLAAAIQLALNRVANQALVIRGDDGLDGEAVLGRCLDRAHVAGARERQVEGTRNGRRAQGEHVDHVAKLFEPFLVHHAKTLLFVDHHQAEVPERDVGLNQPMGANDDIDAPDGEVTEDAVLLAARAKPREQFDSHRVIGHPLAEGVVMLLREDGGGNQNGDLPAREHHLEGGSDGALRLAEADIAANEPVHRARTFEILFCRLDGAQLIRGFLVDERALELDLPGRVRRKGGA